jgi:hypothetical protein
MTSEYSKTEDRISESDCVKPEELATIIKIIHYTPEQQKELKIRTGLQMLPCIDDTDTNRWARVFLGIGQKFKNSGDILAIFLSASENHMQINMHHDQLNDKVALHIFALKLERAAELAVRFG